MSNPDIPSEMVERGAEAMWRAESIRAREKDRSISWSEADEGTRDKFRWLMQAAIEALREPTLDMRLRGTEAGAMAGREIAQRMGDAETAVRVATGNGKLYDAAWRAMIDAALGRP